MAYNTIISTAELAQELENNARLVVLDCRFDLANPGKGHAEYAAGHIPGAIYADLNRDLSGVVIPGFTGRHPLPEVGNFADTLSQWGIDETVQVVAYDDSGGSYAARLWWMLRWLSHEAVAVLDGGWKAWLREGRAVSTTIPVPARREFIPRAQMEELEEAHMIEADLKNGSHVLTLLDARAPDRFRGENETIDPVAGHIPGARNAPWTSNLNAEGYFLPAEQLRERFTQLLQGEKPSSAVAYCGSGVTAAHNLLAMEIAGLHGARLYPGSWSHWITESDRPVATGE